MSIKTSVLSEMLQALPQMRTQIYFKSSLTALSHAMEDQVLAATSENPLLIASFQRESFYRQEANRYRRLAQRSNQVYVLAAFETDVNASETYEIVAFDPQQDALRHEWHLVVISQHYTTCLVCRERQNPVLDLYSAELPVSFDMEPARQFEGIWTSDREVSCIAAELLLKRILAYRPELAAKIAQARRYFKLARYQNQQQQFPSASIARTAQQGLSNIDSDPFVERLVTYLQASQYKLLKAYGSIAQQERKERLVNSITTAIRRGSDTGQPLHPQEILKVAVQQLGQAVYASRCLIYRAQATDVKATIAHEFLSSSVPSLAEQTIPLQPNALFREVVAQQELIYVADTNHEPRIEPDSAIAALVKQYLIRSWLIVPILYQGKLLGAIELHHCGMSAYEWDKQEVALVEAIATQAGAALIQAEAYANLENLNQQLEALDRTRSNLIAITGHELRTPLSTIQVCLESLATEPDMPLELRQIMLNTALADSERMRKLIQDFLTLSNLESGRIQWHLESLPLEECVSLAISRIRTRAADELPEIVTYVPEELPLVRADGDWLVEVISKLLDNACKFTPVQGEIAIAARCHDARMLEVTVADTGRGIEPNRLEVVFDRFYQEEGALRRTAGGTGLGLAICRQIVNSWGGQIWAESAGKDQGSQFHFTVPISESSQEQKVLAMRG